MELTKEGKRKILLLTGIVSLVYWIVPAIQYHYFDSLDIHWVFSVSEIYLFLVMIEKQPIPILVLLASLFLSWLTLYKLGVFIMNKRQKVK